MKCGKKSRRIIHKFGVYSHCHLQMTENEIQNWKKIKDTMEASGKTDNMFYKRACEILKTGRDPLGKFLGHDGGKF